MVPTTIEIEVYCNYDENENKLIFHEEDMKNEFEGKIEELKTIVIKTAA